MGKNIKNKKLNGFSLFEVLITMAIIMMLSLLVFPITTRKVQESKLETYASQLAIDIYYQQQRAYQKNIPSGVSLGVSSYYIFDGDTLGGATDTDLKQYPSNIRITSIALTGTNEITFANGEFKPTSYGYFDITDTQNTFRIYINREGLIWYEKI
jgi:Tfp pilus assembly protein FimT